MKNMQSILLLGGVTLFAGCGREPPPRSVHEFLDEPILLEATMVRCAQNREETRYDVECVNARQAVSLIEAREERARHDAFELESKRKREALIRTQKAAAEARRRAAEAEALRKESEYLAQFGESPPPTIEEDDQQAANAPLAVIPEPEKAQEDATVIFDDPPAPVGSNAPAAETETKTIDAVRDELRRRADDPTN